MKVTGVLMDRERCEVCSSGIGLLICWTKNKADRRRQKSAGLQQRCDRPKTRAHWSGNPKLLLPGCDPHREPPQARVRTDVTEPRIIDGALNQLADDSINRIFLVFS